MSDEGEQVPDGEIFHAAISWSRLEMEQARNFEQIIDHRLQALKQEIMQTYRDRQPPPFALPEEKR